MKILYISAHEVLEYDELLLFTELGHECFSPGGAYTNPNGHWQLKRPGVPGMRAMPELMEVAVSSPRTELPWEIIEPFDVIIIMDGYYIPELLKHNWNHIKHKVVILRTIGQSLPGKEKALQEYRGEGLKIVRYSPMEEKLKNFAGQDAVIRFYKDPDEWCGWTGQNERLINFSQTLKGRRDFCGHDFIMDIAPGFPLKVYGSGNEDLGEFNGGGQPYDIMKTTMRESRAYLYAGTWPASYTLSFIEAWMTGIPMVAAGPDVWKHRDHPDINLYEVKGFIDNGHNGFSSNDTNYLKEMIKKLMDDQDFARMIGENGRKKAIELFGKEKVKAQWESFLNNL